FGTTPAQLWADGAEGIAEAVTQAATGGEGAATDDGTAAADTGANGAAVEDGTGTSDAAADQGAVSGAAKGDDAADDAAESDSSAAMPAVASEQGEPKAAAASATTLSSDAKVFIQDSKDKDNSYSTKSGALSADDTLWANMYDEVEDDWYGTLTESVANPGTWTYTWLAGTTRHSSNVADYTEVVGHEQSLTVTAAMEGKYFICKVTVDGKDYYGPSVSSGSGINANDIPGPVLGAGQMELNSVKLSSDTPSIGDTLTATPYISYYQQALPTPRLPTRGPHPPRSTRASPRSRARRALRSWWATTLRASTSGSRPTLASTR
ncbi:MAG: hypothetical protein ACLTXI_03225, partial [Collinsella sp.]